MHMKKFILILIAILAINFNTLAQMGIGRIPHTGSILDLTNSDNKYLLLPIATQTPGGPLYYIPPGAIIYYQGVNPEGKIYINAADTIKGLTPWKWDGSASGYISSDITNPIGIGVSPIISTPYRLQIADAVSPGVSLSGTSKASILIGDDASLHIAIDNDEIMAKINATAAGTLKLQKEGGLVDIGMSALASTNTVLQVNGSIDANGKGKIKENGNDLIPAGLIIMWSNATSAAIPDGWTLCDGSAYTTVAGVLTNAPDLRNKFIVGAGTGSGASYSAGSSYNIGNTGGTVNTDHKHDFDFLSFTPDASLADGQHTHSGGSTGSSNDSFRTSIAGGGSDYPKSSATHDLGTTDATDPLFDGRHNHTLDIPSSTTEVGSITKQNPPYHALYFIIKK